MAATAPTLRIRFSPLLLRRPCCIPRKKTRDSYADFSTQQNDEYFIRFQIHVARVGTPDHRVGITGNCDALGNWDPEQGLLSLTNEDHPKWRKELRLKKKNFPLYYKYFLYDEHKKQVLFMEDGSDRSLNYNTISKKNKLLIRGDERFNFPRLPWKGAGVSVPVFSLRRQQGYGVGEFFDIKKLADWAATTGMKVLQLLPVDDTVRHPHLERFLSLCSYLGVCPPSCLCQY
ncbi:MAG: 4-alpha-glucanotransferase [Bacteroidales bacterium]|nr:4-alpha-glucanotransferase [Bacteroidales bacterium]